MATYKYDKNGNKIPFMRYDKAAAKTLVNIFPLEKKISNLIKTVPSYKGNLAKQYRVQSLPKLARLIFYNFIKKIMFRVAAGDVFVLPGKTGAYIALKKYKNDSVKKMRQMGFYDNVDIVKARFNIPYFAFDFGPRYPRLDAKVYVPRYISDIALKNVEENKIPWTQFRKQLRYDNNIRGHT
jgi:hypothetical protein